MRLIEYIDNMPSHKSMKFIELWSLQYNKTNSNPKSKYSIAKYGDKEYITFLRRKMTDEEMEKQLEIMVPKTRFSVAKQLFEIGHNFYKMMQSIK